MEVETLSLPLSIGPRTVVYKDEFQELYKIVAEFEGLKKEYVVCDRGRRSALLVVGDDKVLFAQQYRLLIDGLSLEVPGGRVDENELPEQAAIRECREETGVHCRNLSLLLSYQPGLDVLKNPTFIYYSTDFDELPIDNPKRRVWVPLSRCLELIFSQQIVEGMSILALLAYYSRLHIGRGAEPLHDENASR